MKRLQTLFQECETRNWNISLTNQRINGYSVEIYTGYVSTYEKIFYTDGHLKPNQAITEALKFIRKHGK